MELENRVALVLIEAFEALNKFAPGHETFAVRARIVSVLIEVGQAGWIDKSETSARVVR